MGADFLIGFLDVCLVDFLTVALYKEEIKSFFHAVCVVGYYCVSILDIIRSCHILATLDLYRVKGFKRLIFLIM